MPTARYDLSVVTVNDTLYAIGGATGLAGPAGRIPTDATEQYIPIGYGTPTSICQTPIPYPSDAPSTLASPFPSLAPSHTPMITLSSSASPDIPPFALPTSSVSSQFPLSPQSITLQTASIYIIMVIAVPLVLITVGALVMLCRKKKST